MAMRDCELSLPLLYSTVRRGAAVQCNAFGRSQFETGDGGATVPGRMVQKNLYVCEQLVYKLEAIQRWSAICRV